MWLVRVKTLRDSHTINWKRARIGRANCAYGPRSMQVAKSFARERKEGRNSHAEIESRVKRCRCRIALASPWASSVTSGPINSVLRDCKFGKVGEVEG